MDPTIVLFKAIQRLRPDAKFSCHEGIVKEWHDDSIEIPTDIEIEDEKQKVIAEFEASKYQIDRAREYPSITDQLDALFHAGLFPDEMAAKIQAVKDKYPKDK